MIKHNDDDDDDTVMGATQKALAALMRSVSAKTSTAYISDKLVVRLTRHANRSSSRNPSDEFSLTIGRPNFSARKFIKLAKRAGEPFPIKKAQLTFQRSR